MHVKTNCRNFSWKIKELVEMNKADHNKLYLPNCSLNKLENNVNCPFVCKSYEKNNKK